MRWQRRGKCHYISRGAWILIRSLRQSKWHKKSHEKQLIDIICGHDKLAGKNVAKAELPENTGMWYCRVYV